MSSTSRSASTGASGGRVSTITLRPAWRAMAAISAAPVRSSARTMCGRGVMRGGTLAEAGDLGADGFLFLGGKGAQGRHHVGAAKLAEGERGF